ncbi:MAG: ABC transporter ATP-binding protein [Oscillospiraceae bacterium]|nr:ABC transporter ATP-binding protein [Oscillospiraceae bacterium]
MSEILKVSNVTKFYGIKKALNDLSFSVEKGSITGLLGPNGSGKTTLIKIVNSLIDDFTGEVSICGEKISTSTKEFISYLPDVDFLRTDMKIISTLNMYSEFFKSFDKVKALEMLKVVGLDEKDRIKQLSKGNREKLQLVLTMARQAKLYIFDEPIAGVDPAARDFIIETIIKNYHEDGSLLISTHLISDIEHIIDKVIFIKNGEKVLDDDAENIRLKNNKSIDGVFREVFKC